MLPDELQATFGENYPGSDYYRQLKVDYKVLHPQVSAITEPAWEDDYVMSGHHKVLTEGPGPSVT